MNKNAIIVEISGGLGNQLFQFSAGRSLSLKHNCNLILDISWFQNKTNRTFELNNFKLNNYKIINESDTFLNRFKKKLLLKKNFIPTFKETQFHYMKEFDSIQPPCFLKGHWQSILYFKNFQNEIVQELIPNIKFNNDHTNDIKEVNSRESICVHIRRGDYIKSQKTNNYHGTCPISYYKKAVTIITQTCKNPHFYIFSDDLSWVKKEIKLEFPTTYVDNNESTLFDFNLMRNCKYFIIANSTFSWWAAWLSKHDKKIIIAPHNWFNIKNINCKDLIPKNWITI